MPRTDFEPINSLDRLRAVAFHETYCRVSGEEMAWDAVPLRDRKRLMRVFAQMRRRGLLP